jgi:elongator complex protein 3
MGMERSILQEDGSKMACRKVVKQLMDLPIPTREDVDRIKMNVCHELQAPLVRNSDLIRVMTLREREKLLPILRMKPVRTISGVNVVAVMTKPWPCPHGKCAYCPGGPPFGTPQSYTGHEPAAMRGIQHGFDPYLQVRSRIEQLKAMGNPVGKVELIVMGGTFPAMPYDYQAYFVQRCLDAIFSKDSQSLDEAKKNAEVGRIRNVGITVETRPDWAKEEHADRMLSLGVTRVELGVQNVYDDIYELADRGHSVQDVIEATRIVKDAGLKVTYHMMPNLLGSSYERDLEAFKRLFQDACFKPDALKIYPTLVLKGTKLYEMWRNGGYSPYPTEDVVKLIVEVKRMIPRWVRVQRVQRDIPSNLIIAGVKESNLRQMVQYELERQGISCRCIRCREVGHVKLKFGLEPKPKYIKLIVERYPASEGKELFLSYEDVKQDILIGFLKLRYPSEKAHRSEIRGKKAMLVRELHVYGPMIPLSARIKGGWQHRGYGEMLLKNAERIAKEEYDAKKIVVTSGLGVKEYYFRRSYVRDGPYMSKKLD